MGENPTNNHTGAVINLSATTRWKRLSGMRNNPDCYFIGDKSNMLYHRKDSSCVEDITRLNLVACGPDPVSQKFKPCPRCKPEPVPPEQRKKVHGKRTKSGTLQKAMGSVAEQYQMHIEFVGPNVYVTTIAGEWFFDYNTRPITLHHKNEELWYSQMGRGRGHYHVQDKSFSSPMLALAYIYHHEQAAIRRAFQPQTEPDNHSEESPEANQRVRILAALRAASGNKAAAAKILGVSTTTLWRWRKKYGIQ